MIKTWQVYIMIFAIGAMIAIRLTLGRTSNICEIHKDLFSTELRSAFIVEKFIDKENHSFETVVINEGDKSFKLLLVPDANDRDFEYIKVNDKIKKDSNSFRFIVNDEYEFEFQIDCEDEFK